MECPERSRVLARLVAVSSTVSALAAGAHVAGGGRLPSGLGLAVLAALTLAVSAVLAQRRLRVSTLLPVVAVWQWCLHQAFAWAPTSAVQTPVGTAHAGHGGTDLSLVTASMPHHATSASMLAAHAAAVVATVLLLVATERGAERALARWSWAVPVLAGGVAPVGPAVRRTAHVVARVVAPRSTWVQGAVGSRAPPLALLPA